MIVTPIILGVASILASGILFRHQRILTLLAASAALFEVAWLALTGVQRVAFSNTSDEVIFLVGSLLFLVLAGVGWRQWHLPYQATGSGRRDIVILLALLPVLASAVLIQRANGFQGANWVGHGFYNGDSTTFITLVQRSLTTPELVHENPFAANGSLEYPTLVHAGVAEGILALRGKHDWLAFLPIIVFIQILITAPLFFLLRDAVKDVPGWREGYRWRWPGLLLEAIFVVYVMGVSWESYVYPQGHFFTTALFLLLGALLARAWSLRGRLQYAAAGTAALVTVLLLFSNAVTGVAALVVWGVFAVLRWSDSTRPVPERSAYAVSILALILLFIGYGPGEGALQLIPHFSYTAAQNMLTLAAPLVLLFAVLLQQLRYHSFISVATIALSVLAFVTFIFSERNIVVENASRFFYHALLIGWPLGVDGVVRSVRVVQARLRQLDRGPLLVSGVAGVLVVLGVLALPVLASVASVHDHLLFKNEHVSNLPARLAMEWVLVNTEPHDIFLASPNEPWEVPLFTGRSLLRTNYWLSPEDELQTTVNRAFAGESTAQTEAARYANYILLKQDDVERWNLPEEKRVYNFGGVAIYAVAD